MTVGRTGYANCFIAVAADCPVTRAEVPLRAGTVAAIQHMLIADAPGIWTSDALLFEVHRLRSAIPDTVEERDRFWRTPKPCLRASPLAKRHRFGIAFDADARITLHPLGHPGYDVMLSRGDLRQLRAMQTARAISVPAA